MAVEIEHHDVRWFLQPDLEYECLALDVSAASTARIGFGAQAEPVESNGNGALEPALRGDPPQQSRIGRRRRKNGIFSRPEQERLRALLSHDELGVLTHELNAGQRCDPGFQ